MRNILFLLFSFCLYISFEFSIGIGNRHIYKENNKVNVDYNVRRLRPENISCFGAIGDSITAGYSLHSSSPENWIFEYRSESFSIGGRKGVQTLPNIFSQFGSKSGCVADKNTFVKNSLDFLDNKNTKANFIGNSKCNVAISGATTHYLLDMYNTLTNEFTNAGCNDKWKVLTILIGANDICQVCIHGFNQTLINYKYNIHSLFQKIVLNYKNVFVNVGAIFDITKVLEYGRLWCNIVHHYIDECPCLLGDNKSAINDKKAQYLYPLMNDILKEEVYIWNHMCERIGIGDNIYFVYQPFMEKLDIFGREFLSDFDCFHPSSIAHSHMAVGLWNNMFQHSLFKKRELHIDDEVYQINENDYLR